MSLTAVSTKKDVKKAVRVVTHERPHLDEIFAFWLLRKYGEKFFPGISSAQLEFVQNGPNLQLPDNVIALGVGGGMFDEHPSHNGERKREECAATLVAKFLGVDKLPELQTLLRLVYNDDVKGAGYPLDISKLSKLMFEQRVPSVNVVSWVMLGIETKYRAEYALWGEARERFQKIAQVIPLNRKVGGRSVELCVLDGNEDAQVVTFARTQIAGIILNRELGGNVQILLSGGGLGISLDRVAYLLRTAERLAKERRGEYFGNKLSLEEGKAEGNTVSGAEEWYYAPKMGLLNGSKTATGVPATKLSLKLITECIEKGLTFE